MKCPVRAAHTVQNVKPKTGLFIPGKTHRGVCRAWGTKAQSKLRQKLHGDRMPSITHSRNLVDSMHPARSCGSFFFRFAIRIAGWRILPLSISPVLNPAVLWCTTHDDANIRTGSNYTSPPRLTLHFCVCSFAYAVSKLSSYGVICH